MADETGAVGTLLGLGKNRDGGLMRGLFAIVLIAGMAVSGYEIFQHYQYIEPPIDDFYVVNADADRTRLSKMIDSIKTSIDARENSAESVRSAFMASRYPFGAPPRAGGDGALALVDDPYAPQPISLEPVIVPPHVELKGIISLGNSVVAMINIQGEPAGKMYRVGDMFAGRSGKVVKITKNGVTVRYQGKNFDYSH